MRQIDFFFVFGTSITLILLIFTLYKLRRINLTCFSINEQLDCIPGKHLIDLHQQIQALQCLRNEMEFDMGLPPTRGWAASPDFLLLIARHGRETKPRAVMECGSGTSTLILARCMQMNGSGHVYSLDHDPDFAAQTRSNLQRYGLSEWATVIAAPLRQHCIEGELWKWYDTKALPDTVIDLLVIDGPPVPLGGPLVRFPAGPILFPRLASGATVFLDDCAREGEKEIIKRWISRFPEVVRRKHICEKGCVSLFWPGYASKPLVKRQ